MSEQVKTAGSKTVNTVKGRARGGFNPEFANQPPRTERGKRRAAKKGK